MGCATIFADCWALAGIFRGASPTRPPINKKPIFGLVLESGTGNVSFENVKGNVLLTENMAVAGYGGKASGPSGLKSPKDIKMKGSFRIFAAELDGERPDVVPDLTYTHHYGF